MVDDDLISLGKQIKAVENEMKKDAEEKSRVWGSTVKPKLEKQIEELVCHRTITSLLLSYTTLLLSHTQYLHHHLDITHHIPYHITYHITYHIISHIVSHITYHTSYHRCESAPSCGIVWMWRLARGWTTWLGWKRSYDR